MSPDSASAAPDEWPTPREARGRQLEFSEVARPVRRRFIRKKPGIQPGGDSSGYPNLELF
jgi:hypothetical protein